MNEEYAAFKEKEEGFDLNGYVIPVKLSDEKENGRLFGFRFK